MDPVQDQLSLLTATDIEALSESTNCPIVEFSSTFYFPLKALNLIQFHFFFFCFALKRVTTTKLCISLNLMELISSNFINSEQDY